MNINLVTTKNYENISLLGRCQNKPNSKPIKPNLKNAKMNLNFYLSKDYEQKPPLGQAAKQSQFKPNQTQFRTQPMMGVLPWF